ncbi:MAG: hypothetical protein QOI98_197 [Solirubrobacteraceae bacterium]|nr:hypothetical protein [Solirubrobacteraceae bacterium]
MDGSNLIEYAASATVLAAIAGVWTLSAFGRARRLAAERRAHRRAGRATGAALEAAEDQPAFDPEQIRTGVSEILGVATRTWAADGTRSSRSDSALIELWARTRAAALGDGLRVIGDPRIDLLRVVNREGEDEDRIVVRIRARVHRDRAAPRYPGAPTAPLVEPHTVTLDERWTLGRDSDRWLLLSTDGDPLASPILSRPLIPTPGADDNRLLELSMVELGHDDRSDTIAPRELIDGQAPPGLALLDLSASDGRFSPALLGATLDHLVEAWEEATIGSEAPLAALATSAAVKALLQPPDANTRLVLQDASIARWNVAQLDVSADPPRVAVDLTVEGIRWIVDDRDRMPVAGSRTARHVMSMCWNLEMRDDAAVQWRLVESSDPTAALPRIV